LENVLPLHLSEPASKAPSWQTTQWYRLLQLRPVKSSLEKLSESEVEAGKRQRTTWTTADLVHCTEETLLMAQSHAWDNN
jgi:hypothetical protein